MRGTARDRRGRACQQRRTQRHSRIRELNPEKKVGCGFEVRCISFAVSVMKFWKTELEVCSGKKLRGVKNSEVE